MFPPRQELRWIVPFAPVPSPCRRLGCAIAAVTAVVVAACSPGLSPGAQGLPSDIKDVMESPQYANSRWGLMTYDFKTGKQAR